MPKGLDYEVLRAFGITPGVAPDLRRWEDILDRQQNPEGEVTIGVVGKYVGLADAYKSLNEALVAWRHRQPGEGQHQVDRCRTVRAG